MYLTRLRYLTFLCLGSCIMAVCKHADAEVQESNPVHTLPSEVADKLRSLNSVGQRGSCHESNIFIHGYEYLDLSFDKIIWFLGAPDYLCDTNSFVPAIVSANGDWTIGTSKKNSWNGSDLLDGVPRHFAHDFTFGMFLTTEWQIEGPGTLMYHSRDGVAWTSLTLPPETRKTEDRDCCHAASISVMCVASAGDVYVAYEETEVFEARLWVASAAHASENNFNWRPAGEIPVEANCNELDPASFIPRVLREKTQDGAVFDTAYDWAVRIPGPTK